MEDLKTKASEFKDHISEYVKTYCDLLKVKAAKAASGAMASIGIVVIILCLCMLLLIFGFIALAWWLGGLLHSMPLGFLCVAGFFLLLIIITFLLSKKVAAVIRNAVIKRIYE